MVKIGSAVHTAHGLGTVTDTETVRGRTQYKVAGDGFAVWLDETKVAALGDVDESNSTTLPYDYEPQHPVEMYSQESTISPHDHDDVDVEERTHPTNSVTGESEEGGPYPGPAPHLFAARTVEDDEIAAAWDSFNYELCGECGQDADRHVMGSDPILGKPHLYCLDPDNGPLEHRPYGGDRMSFEGSKRVAGDCCDYCGESGHNWDAHPEAVREVEADQRRQQSEEFPFGDHHEGEPVEDFDGYEHFAARTAAGAWGDLGDEPEAGGGHHAKGSAGHYQQYALRNGLNPASSFTADRYSREHGIPVERAEDFAMKHSYRPAGLSDKYVSIHAAADDIYDPVVQFRRDPLAFLQRKAYEAESEGLDPRVGQYMDLVNADTSIRTAAWNDVRTKALRLRREGKVYVKSSTPEAIYATVEGDNSLYDAIIVQGNALNIGGQSVTEWHCGCPWGKWAFKRKISYVGRFCSHAYATYLEMQARHTTGQGGVKQTPNRNRNKPWLAVPQHKKAYDGSKTPPFAQWAEHHHLPLDHPQAKVLYQQELDGYGLPYLLPSESLEDYHALLEREHPGAWGKERVGADMKTRPERDYDVDGYGFDDDGGSGGPKTLNSQPESMEPEFYEVPVGTQEGYTFDNGKGTVTNLGDDRKTTGPDHITAAAEPPDWYHDDELEFLL
jgi:hypothetical protein